MTPEARQVELEEFLPFSDMTLTPTPGWNSVAQKEATRPLVRFVFIQTEYGLQQHRANKMGPEAAVAHFEKRLAAAQLKAA